MNKFIAGLVLAAAVAGCAMPDASEKVGAVTIAHQDLDRLPESLRTAGDAFTGVVIYGDAGYTGLVGNRPYPNVRVDGAPLGKCEKRRAMMVPLAPGPHLVEAYSENNVTHNIDLAEGEVQYFRCNFMRIGGIIFPPAVLKPADADTAFRIVNRE
ncbi:lipoprotein [Actibacterium sp. XHP0104]|uniref:lipoprotein n=1 Tax=Actibacterium sp. XHP0104 TaxID=2984335 RepID=UPI0021E8FE93|nr:hypothetical protein [Actibacterium sp. XHP0104]MCV2881621.1 hypothetical protein [Actibacterium sp. XHP0104]